MFALVMLLVVIFAPLLAIWSLNTLFGLGIAYTLETWFAALVLAGIVGGKSASVSSKGK